MQGTPVTKGQTIRLFHSNTKKWLHSHLVRSPLSGQQEVSAYGSGSKSDTGDFWIVAWDGPNSTWDSTSKVRPSLLETHETLMANACAMDAGEGDEVQHTVCSVFAAA